MTDSHRTKEPIYQYDVVPKSHLKYGKWIEEPDRVEWISGDLLCLVLRHPRGYLQGFVGVPWGRPLWGLQVGDVNRMGMGVHRGLTFGEGAGEYPLSPNSPYAGEIRAKSAAGNFEKPEDAVRLWVFGFHCNHEATHEYPGDFSPDDTLANERPTNAHVYRTFEFTESEVDRLAAQMRDAISRRVSRVDMPSRTNQAHRR